MQRMQRMQRKQRMQRMQRAFLTIHPSVRRDLLHYLPKSVADGLIH
jgi:hypothetical protein